MTPARCSPPAQLLSALAPTLAGFLFDAVSLALPFMLGGGLQVVNAALFHHFFAGTAPDGEDRKAAASEPISPEARSRAP